MRLIPKTLVAVVLFLTGTLVFLGNALENEGPGYIQAGQWQLQFGADNRTRYQSLDSYSLTASDPSVSAVLNRFRLRMEADYEKVAVIFAEGLDAREWAFRTRADDAAQWFDLHQAWVQVNVLPEKRLSLKLGRQKFIFGNKRIISAPTWGNNVRSFDALDIKHQCGKNSLEVFGGSLVDFEETEFNISRWREALSGIYFIRELSGIWTADVYMFARLDIQHDYENNQYILGSRINSEKLPGSSLLDAEAAWQFGGSRSRKKRAYAVSVYSGKKFETVFAPSLKLELNLASGDADSSDGTSTTFEPPYQTLHGTYGIIDLFRWQNFREIALYGKITPVKYIVLGPEIHAYWLDDEHDAWYGTRGQVLKASPHDGTWAGGEVSLTAEYVFSRFFSADAGYSYFISGRLAEQAGDNNGIHFLYMQTMFGF